MEEEKEQKEGVEEEKWKRRSKAEGRGEERWRERAEGGGGRRKDGEGGI